MIFSINVDRNYLQMHLYESLFFYVVDEEGDSETFEKEFSMYEKKSWTLDINDSEFPKVGIGCDFRDIDDIFSDIIDLLKLAKRCNYYTNDSIAFRHQQITGSLYLINVREIKILARGFENDIPWELNFGEWSS